MQLTRTLVVAAALLGACATPTNNEPPLEPQSGEVASNPGESESDLEADPVGKLGAETKKLDSRVARRASTTQVRPARSRAATSESSTLVSRPTRELTSPSQLGGLQ
jgi:hypothetical protein